MERRDVIKGLAAALGGLVTFSGCSEEEKCNEEQEGDEKQEGDEEQEPIVSAMCYAPPYDGYEDYVCSLCDNIIKEKYSGWMVLSINSIEEIVNQIMDLDYDVVLDKAEFCPNCSQKNIENPEIIFKIRFSEEPGYHIARSNIVNEYQCLFEFLSNPDKFTGNRAIIQKMTGLGEDLKIPK
jgi:hypothetical protein